MGVQKLPLSRQQLAKLENVALAHGKDSDAYRIFMILRYTGCHASVLSDRTLNLHEEVDEEGNCFIVWTRPKRGRNPASNRTSIPKSSRIRFDVGEFARNMYSRKRRRSRRYIWEVIKRLGEEAGIPSLSPLSLRHSLAVELLDEYGWPEVLVSQVLNVDRKTLKWYGRFTDKRIVDRFKSINW